MPSPPFKLTPAQTNITLSLPVPTGWIWVDNPTGSPILVAIGRTDIPTDTSADVFIPILSTMLVPTYGARDFGLTFQSVAGLGNPIPQVTATIILGNRGELAPSFGSIQQNKQMYYDRPNLKTITSMIGGTATISSLSQSLYSPDYVVPKQRKTVITLVTLTVFRQLVNVANAAVGSALTLFQIRDPNNTLFPTTYSAQLFPGDQTKNYIGASDKVIIPLELPLLTGWSVHIQASNSDNAGGTTVHQGDIFMYEFDA